MSSFSNGNYVPLGMDFSDQVEYLEEKRDTEKFALIDKEFEEFYTEFFDLEPEEKFKLSLPEEHLSFLKHEADSFIDEVKKSLSGKSKSEKFKTLTEIQRETRERLLFNFVKHNKVEVFYSVLRSLVILFWKRNARARPSSTNKKMLKQNPLNLKTRNL